MYKRLLKLVRGKTTTLSYQLSPVVHERSFFIFRLSKPSACLKVILLLQAIDPKCRQLHMPGLEESCIYDTPWLKN